MGTKDRPYQKASRSDLRDSDAPVQKSSFSKPAFRSVCAVPKTGLNFKDLALELTSPELRHPWG